MSDSELKDAPIIIRFNSESETPEISTNNSTPYLSVNVGQTLVSTPHDWALGHEDSNSADSSPNASILAGNVPLEETGLNTGGYFQVTPTPFTPGSKSV